MTGPQLKEKVDVFCNARKSLDEIGVPVELNYGEGDYRSAAVMCYHEEVDLIRFHFVSKGEPFFVDWRENHFVDGSGKVVMLTID
jgi:hypothetical protein